MIDLLGVYSKSKNCIDELPSLTMYPCEAQSTYSAFFHDYGFADGKLPPFKFNKTCFDFGRVLPKNFGKNQNENIAVAILKNNMLHDFTIRWYKGISLKVGRSFIKPFLYIAYHSADKSKHVGGSNFFSVNHNIVRRCPMPSCSLFLSSL